MDLSLGAGSDADDLDLLDSDLDEDLKYEAVEVTIFKDKGSCDGENLDSVEVKPVHKQSSEVKLSPYTKPTEEAESIPEYEEIEDDANEHVTSQAVSSDESLSVGLDIYKDGEEIGDDIGVEVKPGSSTQFDTDETYRYSVTDKQYFDNLEVKSSRNTLPVIIDVSEMYDVNNRTIYCNKYENVNERVDGVSPSVSNIEAYTDYEMGEYQTMSVDSDLPDDQFGKVQADGLKRRRPHPYKGPVVGKGKQSTIGTTRIKSSSKTRHQQVIVKDTGQTRVDDEVLAVPSKHQQPLSLPCESCDVIRSHNSMVQCCNGHMVCMLCVEKEAKLVITGAKKGSVECSTSACNSSIPQSELRKALPGIVLDLLEESWKKETLEALENMNDGVKCPGCGYSGVLETAIKNFKCNKCKKNFCRLCEMEWSHKQHDLCVKMTKKVSEATGHTINLPAHWDLDPNTEKEMGFSAVELEQMGDESLDVMAKFSQSLSADPCTVTRIYRIQNQRLWEKYSLFRTHMTQDIGELQINERRLFHGTNSKVIDSICKEGFDWRLCGKHGTAYGHGTYFAKDSKYSTNYSSANGRQWFPPKTNDAVASEWTREDSPSRSGTSFPPSFTQSMRFNVLTGQAPAVTHTPTRNRGAGTQQPVFRPSSISQQSSQQSFLNSSNTFASGPWGGLPVSSAPVNSSALPPSSSSNNKTKRAIVDDPVISLRQNRQSRLTPTTTSTPATFNAVAALSVTMPGVFNTWLSPSTSTSASMIYRPISNFGLQPLSQSNHLGQTFAWAPSSPSSGLMYMFVARVLVGKKCVGSNDMRRPDGDAHTAVDNLRHSRIYVVFEKGQCYPEYLIEYSKNK